jgi:hypothetical protein
LPSAPNPGSETALVDANVFYSLHQRNVFVTLATQRLFALHWTDRIQREWLNALLRERPDLSPERLTRTARLMSDALPNARLHSHEKFEALCQGTDGKDRHVAAAAIQCAPSSLVTWNLKHFEAKELATHRVSVIDPDSYLADTFDRDPSTTHAATRLAFSFLKRPGGRPTWLGYVDILERDGLKGFAQRLRDVRHEEREDEDLDTDPGP